MKLVIQRVNHASVHVDGTVCGAIDQGLLVLIGVGADSTEADAMWLARKTANLRIFGQDRMSDSVGDIDGAVLAISQFTLYGDCKKGSRPSFTSAAPPERGAALYEAYCAALEAYGIRVAKGRFGAHMVIDAQCDGPVTINLEHGSATP